MHISQRKYVLDLLIETGILGCELCDTPIAVKKKKKKVEESKDGEEEEEWEEEGQLVDEKRSEFGG